MGASPFIPTSAGVDNGEHGGWEPDSDPVRPDVFMSKLEFHPALPDHEVQAVTQQGTADHIQSPTVLHVDGTPGFTTTAQQIQDICKQEAFLQSPKHSFRMQQASKAAGRRNISLVVRREARVFPLPQMMFGTLETSPLLHASVASPAWEILGKCTKCIPSNECQWQGTAPGCGCYSTVIRLPKLFSSTAKGRRGQVAFAGRTGVRNSASCHPPLRI